MSYRHNAITRSLIYSIYVRPSLWPDLMFCKLKITNILVGTGKESVAMGTEFFMGLIYIPISKMAEDGNYIEASIMLQYNQR